MAFFSATLRSRSRRRSLASSNFTHVSSSSSTSLPRSSRNCGGLAGEVFTLEDAPLLQHGHHHVVEVDARVVDATDGDDDGLAAELRHRVSGHLEVAQHAVQGLHRLVGGDVDAGFADVAVEDHVQVLVGRDALQQLVGDGLVARLAGVAVRHAGGELLERHVDDGVEQALGEHVALPFWPGLKPRVTCSTRSSSSSTGSIARVTTR